MAIIFHLLVLCVFTVVVAEKKWWQTGEPFNRPEVISRQIRETSPWQSTPRRITHRPCQCVRPKYCRDNFDTRYSLDSRCEVKGERCCDNLKLPEPYVTFTGMEMNENKLDSNDNVKDVSDEYSYTESFQIVQRKKASPKSTSQVINLANVGESTGEKRVKWACGKAHFQLDDKGNNLGNAINNDANFAEYPWTLALLEETEFGTPIRCAAALIDAMVAVTAAHCVAKLKREKIIVRAGEWDLNNEDEDFAHQDRRVKQVVVHEDYDPINLDNDTALLFLDKAYEEARHIATICLPDKEKIKEPCLATGWGQRTEMVSPSLQHKMKRVELDLVYGKTCQKKLRETDLGQTFNLSRSALCAKKKPKGNDTGYGDGGAPLVCYTPKGRFVLIGIASWGKKDYPDMPGVYTNVSKLKKWIEYQRILFASQ